MADMTMTKNERERDQLGEKIFTDIYSVIIDNGLNIDPLANECGDAIDDLVEFLLDTSERNSSDNRRTVVR
jgi:hypothetical protein